MASLPAVSLRRDIKKGACGAPDDQRLPTYAYFAAGFFAAVDADSGSS